MKAFTIQQPCDEDFKAMRQTSCGGFCNKCEKEVVDITRFSTQQTKEFLYGQRNDMPCLRMRDQQLLELQDGFEAWTKSSCWSSRFLFVLFMVFGMGLFSCEDDRKVGELSAVHFDWQHAFSQTKEVANQSPVDAVQSEQFDSWNEAIGCPGPEMGEVIAVFEETEMVTVEEEKEIDVERVSVTMGVSMMTVEFERYLYETQPLVEYDENGEEIPQSFDALVYPNPVASEANVKLMIPQTDQFNIQVVDVTGKVRQLIFQGELIRGTREMPFTLDGAEPGRYWVVIRSKSYSESIQIVKPY
jgi:hypothetical protein